MARRIALLGTLGLAAALSACSTQVSEAQLLRLVAGGGLMQNAITAVAPAYTVSRQSITAADGTRLGAVLLRQPGARATVLYFGGNGFTLGRFGPFAAQVFAPLGVDLMIVDHRGYGTSAGTPTMAALEADGLAAFDHLAELVGAGAIFVHGQSLGSFTAGHVGANQDAAGVILESSVTTAEEWIAARGGLQAKLVKVELADGLKGRGNLSNVARIQEPLLLLVGRDDGVTPPALSEALWRASPLPASRKSLAVVTAAGHNDVLVKPDAITAYRGFLERAFAAR